MRIFFKKGMQREFLNLVIRKISAPSLRGLLQFGLSTNYSTLKNYYTEKRSLPKSFFQDLLEIASMNKSKVEFTEEKEHWGKVKGGKISKRSRKT